MCSFTVNSLKKDGPCFLLKIIDIFRHVSMAYLSSRYLPVQIYGEIKKKSLLLKNANYEEIMVLKW